MSTVPRNKGSYYQRPGSGACQVRIPLGWNDEKNAYDFYYEETVDEYEAIALIQKINDFLYHGGKPSEIEGWRHGVVESEQACKTVGEYIEEYCALKEGQKKFASRTIQSDRERLSRAVPYIGDKPLDQVKTLDIELMMAAMQSTGSENLNGFAYSGTTALNTFNTLKKLFNKAIVHGYINANPCRSAETPEADTEEKRALSPRQAREVNEYIANQEPSAHLVGIAIGLNAGLRLSEMLAISWRDYDGAWLSVNKSLVKEKRETKKTKNKENRVVPCPALLSQLLDKWQLAQKEFFESNGLRWSSKVPIVSSKVGGYITQRNYTRWFESVRDDLPVPIDWCFHEFRHSYISILNRDAHIDGRTVRSMSGHKDERAFETYKHTNDEWMLEAARRFQALCAPWTGEPTCVCCAFWTRSPKSLTLGACWASEPDVVVTKASHLCKNGGFRPGTPTFPSLDAA